MIFRNRLPRVQSFLRPVKMSASSASFVCRMMLTFCCHLGRMSALQAATLPRCEPRHVAAIGRFLGRQRWAKGDWMAPLRAALFSHETAKGGFFFLLDQTSSSRQGAKTPNTFCTGNRTRRPCKGRRYNHKKTAPKRCHAFVCGLLLTPSGLRIPYRRPYYTKEYCQQKGYTHRTQAELGAEMIRALELPPTAKVVVLGDTAYEAASVQQACAERDWHWITPCNAERVLAGRKPRPKVRTLLKEAEQEQRFVAVKVHPDTDPYAAQRRWSASALDRRNKGRTYWVWKKRVEVHSVGEVLVFVSTTKKPQPGQPLHEPKILLSNDLDLTARQAVLQYTLRWQIELFFKECKSVLGMVQYRFATFERVERWVDLVLATYLYLEWYRWGRLDRPGLSQKERAWWQSQRTAGLCRAVRREREDKELQWLEKRLATPGGCKCLRQLLRAGLPTALREPRRPARC